MQPIQPISNQILQHVRFGQEQKAAPQTNLPSNKHESPQAAKQDLHRQGMLNVIGGVFDGFALPALLTGIYMYTKGAALASTLPVVGGILALGAIIGKGVNSIIKGAHQLSSSR